MAPLHPAATAKGFLLLRVSKYLPPLASSPRPQNQTAPSCLSWPTGAGSGEQQKLPAWLIRKLLAKGAPLRDHPSFKMVTTLLENKKAQLVVIAGDEYSSKRMIFQPALSHKMEGVIINGKARLAQRKLCTTMAFTTVNSEDKGPKTKVVGAIRAR